MSNEQKQQYDQPATFVGTKRVRVGDKDSKGRDKTTLTFGLTNRNGQEINTCDDLIAALLPYQGKQVNFTIYVEEKEAAGTGRKFPSAFVKVTEMIQKDAQAPGTRTAFVPKQSRGEAVKAKSAQIRQNVEK